MIAAKRMFSVATVALILSGMLQAQQVPDTEFNPPIANPAFPTGTGPVVAIDEAHFNLHTATGGYQAFARLLRRDGYVVKASTDLFTQHALEGIQILVISNALAKETVDNWTLPTPSAFTDEEISAVHTWVEQGGSLFLIVDHMPMPGAASKLGAAFGATFTNGYVIGQEGSFAPITFHSADGSLNNHPMVHGRTDNETVDAVTTFTGTAFQFSPDTQAEPIFILGESAVSLLTETAGKFTPETPRQSVAGWWQGAVLKVGTGRVAIFGEAAMFSAQVSGADSRPMGMNAPNAAQNPQFLLNLIHWLSGLL